jgi:ABC-type nitrate/sulfonate/bicarbonate transport system permease component
MGRAVDDNAMDALAKGRGMSVAPIAGTKAAGSRGERPTFLYRRSGIWTVRIVTAIVILVSWQLYARNLSRVLAAPPTKIAVAMYHQVITVHTIWGPLGSSLTALSLGFLISMVIGLPVGIAMGRWRPIEHVLDPYVSFLYALPHVAFVPLMIIWFGFELKFRLVYVVFSAVFPVVINTMTGVKNVDPALLEVGESFCASERKMLRTIVLPAAAPFMVAGGRQAFSSAWVGVVVAEVLSTQTGLGGQITHFGNYFLTADMFVPILFIMMIAVVIQVITDFLQTRLTPWSNSTPN